MSDNQPDPQTPIDDDDFPYGSEPRIGRAIAATIVILMIIDLLCCGFLLVVNYALGSG